MFPNDHPALAVSLPSPVPPIALSLPVCRNLQSVTLEALHNAAKHAHAAHVEIGLKPERGGKWQVWIRDDGKGFSTDAPRVQGGGMGLDSMRRRAAEIAADLTIEGEPGKGTRVSMIFDPVAEERPVPTASHGRARAGDR
jgi:two-component system nitrate/nitrite sensor histidine kinase NarX